MKKHSEIVDSMLNSAKKKSGPSVDEIKAGKAALEKEIYGLLQAFEQKTGAKVSSVWPTYSYSEPKKPKSGTSECAPSSTTRKMIGVEINLLLE